MYFLFFLPIALFSSLHYFLQSTLSASVAPQKKSSSENNLSTLPTRPVTTPPAKRQQQQQQHKRQSSASSTVSSSADFLNPFVPPPHGTLGGGYVSSDSITSGGTSFHQSSSNPDLLGLNTSSIAAGGYVTTDQFGFIPFTATAAAASAAVVSQSSEPALINLQSPTASTSIADQFSGYVQAPEPTSAPIVEPVVAPPLRSTEPLPTLPEMNSTSSLTGYVQLPEDGTATASTNNQSSTAMQQQQQQQQKQQQQPQQGMPSQFPQAASSSGYFAMPDALNLSGGSFNLADSGSTANTASLSAASTPSDDQDDNLMMLSPLPDESPTTPVAHPASTVTKPEGGGGGGGYGGSIVALSGSGMIYSSTTLSGKDSK